MSEIFRSLSISAPPPRRLRSMVVARPRDASAFAETLVHELRHSKLGALLPLFPMLDDRAELYYAPRRPTHGTNPGSSVVLMPSSA